MSRHCDGRNRGRVQGKWLGWRLGALNPSCELSPMLLGKLPCIPTNTVP